MFISGAITTFQGIHFYKNMCMYEHIIFIISWEEIIFLNSVFCHCIFYKIVFHWNFKYLLNASYIKNPMFVPQEIKGIQVTNMQDDLEKGMNRDVETCCTLSDDLN